MINTKLKYVFIMLLFSLITTCECLENEIESRGKKKKIAWFVFFADIVLKKIFILKLIYAFVFWVVIHKAGYFLTWFVSYLKETKSEHYDHHSHYIPHHYEYGPHGPYRKEGRYSPPGPYRKESHGIY
ncbi:unnamed protein product [Euphydryas editha]|uniref:Uncharacterized protein n=1 Tax=Euphydryas editha TaxID=104508 RepID=A0AAU9US54_EUPED|nr:unnamed protein product [Euphydryas editha]